MIPFRDANPSQTFPIVTVSLIVINTVVFFYELSLAAQLEPFLMDYGVVPGKWHLFGQIPYLTLPMLLLPYVSSVFLHGGWFHLISNMWYLWIFGDNIEDRLGHGRFLVFYLLAGILAGIVHTVFNLDSNLPAVGASGAIAGVLGAYLVTFPHARIETFIPFFFYYEIVDLPAALVLGFWFLAQFLSGTAAIAVTAQGGGVAWWAHIGGFLSGIFLFYFLEPSARKRSPRHF